MNKLLDRNPLFGLLIWYGLVGATVLACNAVLGCGITDDVVFTRADWSDAEARVTKLDAHYREVIDDLAVQYAEAQAKAAAGEEVPDIDLDVADATEAEGRAVLEYYRIMSEAGEGNFPSTFDDNEPAE